MYLRQVEKDVGAGGRIILVMGRTIVANHDGLFEFTC